MALREEDSSRAWKKVFAELAQFGFEACSSSVMSVGKYVLPEENHGVMVSTSFEEHIRENPSITQGLDVMRRFGSSNEIIAANRLHPHYAQWSENDRAYLRCMAEFGFRGGLAAAVHDPMRRRFTFITASSLSNEEEVSESFDQIAPSFLPAVSFLIEGLQVKALRKSPHFRPLSPREQECLLWVCAGLMNSAIAERMGLSEHTVQEYLRNAATKLCANTRAQAAARAAMLGLIAP